MSFFIKDDAKKAIQEKNYSLGGSPLAILGSDFKTKSIQVSADGARTKATLNLFFTELCHGIVFEVQPVRDAAGMQAITDQFVGAPVVDTNVGTLAATITARALQPLHRSLDGTDTSAGKGLTKKRAFYPL